MNPTVVLFLFAISIVHTRAELDEVDNKKPKLWALLVAGSNSWFNYRHQADVCHAYQILHRHGIPDERIVVMMYDDLAQNPENPTPGIVINHLKGSDVYHGVPKDYTGKDVTPQNFLKILQGEQPGVGSGKVIDSGPNDHIFVNFVDHGGPGILAFSYGADMLTVKELLSTLKAMHHNQRYKKMVLYVEACESGSMFRGVLPSNINIYATTAANYNESSYACYYDKKRQTYLGDVYSVKWMEDSDKEDLEKETLYEQYSLTKRETNTSHVEEYGDIAISKLTVGEFQGEREVLESIVYPKMPYDAVPSRETPLDVLYKRLSYSQDENQKQLLLDEINSILARRNFLHSFMNELVQAAVRGEEQQKRIWRERLPITDIDCHHTLTKAFDQSCFQFSKNPYAMKYAYVLVNMCEEKLDVGEVTSLLRQQCAGGVASQITGEII